MERNTRQMEESMRSVTTELQEQLNAARASRIAAEHQAASVKRDLEPKIRDLQNALEEQRKKR